MRYIIYCDESDAKGTFYSHFYGGVLIEARKQAAIEKELQAVKDDLNIFDGEIKWQRITEPYKDKYIKFLHAVFDIIDRGDMKIRIMFTQNRWIPHLEDYHIGNDYFLLYYQFIKHAFGLRYSVPGVGPASAAVLLDEVPHNKEKFAAFRRYLSGLSDFPIWREAGFSIAHDDIAEVDSRNHNIMQALDVVLGAVQSRLNEKHTRPVPPAKRRGKRALAKADVYAAFKGRLMTLYPRFNVGISTGTPNGPQDRWNHAYRHWLFVPTNAYEDGDRTKKAARLRK